MPVTENGIATAFMPKMTVWIISCRVDVVPFLQKRVVFRSRCLEIVDLRGISKKHGFRRALCFADSEWGLACRRGQETIVAIAIGCARRLKFELRHGIAQMQ